VSKVHHCKRGGRRSTTAGLSWNTPKSYYIKEIGMKGKIATIVFRVVVAILAVYAYFGGNCPAQGCPACKWMGK